MSDSVRPTIAQQLVSARLQLEPYSPSAGRDARLLLAHVLDCSVDVVLQSPTRALTLDELQRFQQAIARRQKHEPVSRIIGKRGFDELEFIITPHTLDPRPDSETFIQAAFELLHDNRQASLNVLDLGTGSGCLLLTLLHHLPHARGVGVDLSADAVAVAKTNAAKLQLDDRCQFVHGHYDCTAPHFFDLIVTNPPYIPTAAIEQLAPDVKHYDPRLALDGGTDGMDHYRQLAPIIQRQLARGGLALIEFEPIYGHPAPILAAHELVVVGARADLSGSPRILIVRHAEEAWGDVKKPLPNTPKQG